MGALQFLSMIANAKEFEARINAFVQVRDEAIKARGEFVGLQEKHAAADAAREGYESMCAAARRRIESLLHDLRPTRPPSMSMIATSRRTRQRSPRSNARRHSMPTGLRRSTGLSRPLLHK